MRYNAQTDCFEIKPEELKRAAGHMYYALRNVRTLAGLPLDKYEQKGGLQPADHAQCGIINAAAAVGIYLGAEWGNELDLRKTS